MIMRSLLYKGEAGLEYPLSLNQLFERYPNTSWDLLNFELPDGWFVLDYEELPPGSFEFTYSHGVPEKVGDGYIVRVNRVETSLEQREAQLANMRLMISEQIAQKRRNVEANGIEFDGVKIDTSIESQNRIVSMISLGQITKQTTYNFKAVSGFVAITHDALIEIASEISYHVQRCFNTEAVVSEELANATTYEQLTAFDIDAVWDSNF